MADASSAPDADAASAPEASASAPAAEYAAPTDAAPTGDVEAPAAAESYQAEPTQSAAAGAAAVPASLAAEGSTAKSFATRGSVRIPLPANPVPQLQFLTFYSWWTELGTKRYIEICFDMQTELFQITLDKDVQHLSPGSLFNANTESLREVTAKDTKVMSMHLHEKLSDNQHADSLRRNHLNAWDLHVGARLNIHWPRDP